MSRSSTGGIKKKSCSPHEEEGPISSSLPITSYGEFVMDSFKVHESHSQADGDEEGDTNSLAVLHYDSDSNASHDFFDIATDNSKVSTKVYFNSRQGSMEGVRTLATVASSTTSVSTLKDLRASAGSGATENKSAFGFHSEDDGGESADDNNDFIQYLFGNAESIEESSSSYQDQGGDDHINAKEDAKSTRDIQESTPPRQEKTPRRCTIDNQLLQKQIKYLQQDSEPLFKSKSDHTTSSSNAVSSRQMIIYQPTKKRNKDLVEETLTLIRRRRDIMHKRNSHNRVRKTHSSRSSSRGATRRLSF